MLATFPFSMTWKRSSARSVHLIIIIVHISFSNYHSLVYFSALNITMVLRIQTIEVFSEEEDYVNYNCVFCIEAQWYHVNILIMKIKWISLCKNWMGTDNLFLHLRIAYRYLLVHSNCKYCFLIMTSWPIILMLVHILLWKQCIFCIWLVLYFLYSLQYEAWGCCRTFPDTLILTIDSSKHSYAK